MEQKEELNEITQQTEKIQLDSTKNKLKDLFSQIEKEKKVKTKKLNTNSNVHEQNYTHLGDTSKLSKSSKISDTKKYQKDYDDTIKKTKPTKPDFTQQFIENGLIGLNQKNSNNTNQYKGLINFGNICYSNVVVQCLIALKEFVQMLKIIFDKLQDVDGLDLDKNFPVLSKIVKIQNFYESKEITF